MTDIEMLTLAAKAAGMQHIDYSQGDYDGSLGLILVDGIGRETGDWNPLADDGDALRLAVKLDLHVLRFGNMTTAKVCTSLHAFDERDNGDPLAATRRAILRCAAEIGKAIRTEGGAA